MGCRLALGVSSLALGLAATAALADGVPTAGRVATYSGCGYGSFAGAYIGAALGYGRQHGKFTNQAPVVGGNSLSNDDGSATFGGYGGYNWQCGRAVLGVEADFNYLNTEPTAYDDTVTVQSNIDWFGTVRARAGIAIHDSVLLYATGGLAYANVDHTFSDTAGPSGPFSQSNSKTQSGWTIGGGAEFLHDSNWTLRAEALWVDLGDKTVNYSIPGGGCPSGICQAQVNYDDDFWVARIGLSYKFGEREPVVPLK